MNYFLKQNEICIFIRPNLLMKKKKLFSYKPVDILAFGFTSYTCVIKILPFLPENRENIVELFKKSERQNSILTEMELKYLEIWKNH